MVWSNAPRVSLAPIDFLRNHEDAGVELTTIVSNAMKNAYARAGYIYPEAHQQHTFYSDEAGKEASRELIRINSCIELHIKLLWKGAQFQLSIPEVVLASSSHSVSEEFDIVSRLSLLEAKMSCIKDDPGP